MDQLINKVAESGIEVFDLEQYYPDKEMVIFDIKDYLFQNLILKEKDFREALKNHDWTQYVDKIVLIQCNTDAIIPMWSYMLISTYLHGNCHDLFVGTKEEYIIAHYSALFDKLDEENFDNKRIVIKGCSNRPIPPAAYAAVTNIALKKARSVMFGEPCSTVPVYKRK
jgi:hypothetical protein